MIQNAKGPHQQMGHQALIEPQSIHSIKVTASHICAMHSLFHAMPLKVQVCVITF